MVLRYTLDTNCIIDLEERRPSASSLKMMLGDHTAGKIHLAIVAISASENQPCGTSSNNYSVFEGKLKAIGLGHLDQLFPMFYWDVGFWDRFIWDGDPKLERKIHEILFPGEPIAKPQDFGFSEKIWRNHKCDVQVAWSHIYYGRDVLVTRDNNFHNNADKLRSIGLNKIIRPDEYKP